MKSVEQGDEIVATVAEDLGNGFSRLIVPSKEEMGSRVRWVRKNAGLSGRELGALLHNKNGALATRLERGESLDYQRMVEIANICAGRGALARTSPQEVLDFLGARTDQLLLTVNGSSNQMSYYGEKSAKNLRPIS